MGNGNESATNRGDYAYSPAVAWGDGVCTEGDVLRCEMPVVQFNYAEDDTLVPVVLPCDEEVVLTWAFSIPVVPGEVIAKADVSKVAITNGWRLECAAGHVHGMTGDPEVEQEFDPGRYCPPHSTSSAGDRGGQ